MPQQCPNCKSSSVPGATKRGVDGKLWVSNVLSNGTYRWQRKPTKARPKPTKSKWFPRSEKRLSDMTFEDFQKIRERNKRRHLSDINYDQMKSLSPAEKAVYMADLRPNNTIKKKRTPADVVRAMQADGKNRMKKVLEEQRKQWMLRERRAIKSLNGANTGNTETRLGGSTRPMFG